jgi:DnaK suppressor protein
MKKSDIEKLKDKLKEQKSKLETQLKSFAKKDKKLEHDWDTKYPHINGGVGSQRAETASDEVEEYATLLSIEYSLETQLKDINLALEKIKEKQYGKCEKCKKPISLRRLQAFPAAKTCSKCK